MNIKTSTFGVLAACVAFAAPTTSDAKAGPAAALDACVKSFVQTYLPDRTVRHVDKAAYTPHPLSVFAKREYTVLLSARGADSGTLIAEAQCVASRDGIVLVLDSAVAAHHQARADFVVSLR